jgi:CRISPR/Cas system-associated exonuclease Cas4 (RecB family)
MTNLPLTYLKNLNPHVRDERIQFDEPTHIYTIQRFDIYGNIYYDSTFTSVTTWNHSHFSHFDNDTIIKKMMNSTKWKQNKYYGMSSQQIKDLWENNRDEAAKAGTLMHYDIECYYNNVTVTNNSIEYKYFQKFEEDRTRKEGFGENLKPYRTEWTVFDEELRLSGSIDMVYEDSDGLLQIYDWKRSREIKKANPWQSSHVECINHIPDSNFWHYSLQLNTYKAILERNYNKIVTELYLVVLHPDNDNYKRIKVPILKQEIKDLFDLRKKLCK